MAQRRRVAASSFLLRNARLVPIRSSSPTVLPDPPVNVPLDVLVIDGRVVEIGENLPRPPGANEHDAAGRWLIPGLWDQHVHLGQWTQVSQRLDLTGTRSVEEVLARVTARLVAAPDAPVVGWGQRSAGWTRQPTVRELDEVTGSRPVVLISGDGHNAWLNTAALRGLRLPPHEGPVAETEWFAAYSRLGSLVGEDGTSPESYLRTLRAAAAKGVAGLVDLEFDQSLAAWPERESVGVELLRVKVGAYIDTLPEFTAAGLCTGDPLPGCGPLVTMGPLKIISDGSLNTRTAWCCEPYAVGGGTGAANLSGLNMRSLLAHARDHGLETAVHAIGDAAVHEALAAFEETGATGSIEHAQMMNREDSRTMARLGIRASVQPAHLLDDRELTELFWPDRTDRCFALRWLHDDGVEVVFGSDAPVSPLDPWDAMAAAVHRAPGEGLPWHPEQALTVHEALAASTNGLGTVAPGHPADLALLDDDPLPTGSSQEQAAALRRVRVAATWVNGRQAHYTL
jgi:predicted amidohydrolase YtcJ